MSLMTLWHAADKLLARHRLFPLELFLVGLAILSGGWLTASTASFQLPGLYPMAGIISARLWGLLFLGAGSYYGYGLHRRSPWICIHSVVPLFFGWSSFLFDFLIFNPGLLGVPLWGCLTVAAAICWRRLAIVIRRPNHRREAVA